MARLDMTWSTLADMDVEAPGSLQTMLTRMLQKEIKARFPTDQELLDAFVGVGRDVGLSFERL
jgi:hypothetical protein